jgi:uncharacterized protein YdbL (DUF1318 family)
MTRALPFAAAVIAGALLLAAPAQAQNDALVTQARANGAVGEQADGYLGFAPGASISADLRGRVEQINIQRRALYTRRAAERNVSACEVFERRIAVGERYRNERGQWRQRTASAPVEKPSFCP